LYQAIREAPQKMAELDQMRWRRGSNNVTIGARAAASLDLIAIATLNETSAIAAAAPFAGFCRRLF